MTPARATLRIAVPSKGRLRERSVELLTRAGLRVRSEGRRLYSVCSETGIGVIFANAQDIPSLVAEGAVERVVRAAFDLMEVITFYTAGETESRAWIVPRKTRAVKAAGTIHSDIERGFIRAEVVQYDVLAREGSWNACRDKGLLRLEGKDYPIAEADVVYFRFNV